MNIQEESKKELQESEDEDDEPDHPMPESLKLMLGEALHKDEEESRPTRSSLHVDTIGLTSSTLDLELHALRNLVFHEILGGESQPTNQTDDSEEIDNQIEVEPKRENEIEKEDKLDIEQSPTENLDFVEEMELLDEPITKLSPKERFLGLGQTFSSLSKEYASKIWHERKRLRLKRRGELKDLQESLPQEKKAKFKPRRQDFSLELLCGNNLFDNIIIESSAVLKEVESALYLASKSSRFCQTKETKIQNGKFIQ